MLIRGRRHSDDEQWAPVSDLMAVVMLIFMLIVMILFIAFDKEKKESAEHIKEVRATVLDEEQKKNAERCAETRAMLNAEFRDDFRKWCAVLEEDLAFRFANQRVLFDPESPEIKEPFKEILQDFLPRYMDIIGKIQEKFGEDDKPEVLAIRIEGHTSSEYKGGTDPYIFNLSLSQNRAFNIVQYALTLDVSREYRKTVIDLVTANGLSYSKRIYKAGEEDQDASRRVEFKLLTRSCQKAGAYDNVQRTENPCLPENDDES